MIFLMMVLLFKRPKIFIARLNNLVTRQQTNQYFLPKRAYYHEEIKTSSSSKIVKNPSLESMERQQIYLYHIIYIKRFNITRCEHCEDAIVFMLLIFFHF